MNIDHFIYFIETVKKTKLYESGRIVVYQPVDDQQGHSFAGKGL